MAISLTAHIQVAGFEPARRSDTGLMITLSTQQSPSCFGCTAQGLIQMFAYLLEQVDGDTQIFNGKLFCDGIGPGNPPLLDIVECCVSLGRDLHQLGAAMKGIFAISDETILFQAVCYLLHTLAGKTHTTCNVGDRNWTMLDYAEHLPTRTAQTNRIGKLIARFQQQPIDAKDLDNQFGEGIAL
jgi:hypothetical protein